MPHLLIDGYNVLPVTDYSTREAFVQTLIQYHQTKKHRLTVVFDGTHQGKEKEEHIHTGGIHIIFSSLTIQADEVIEQLLPSLKGEDLVVVSSDRRIQKAAERMHKPFMSSQEFAKKLLHISVPRSLDVFPPKDLLWAEGREKDFQPKKSKTNSSSKKLSKKERNRRKSITRL